MTLEQELKRLEDIAKKLESEDLPLEEAILLFEQGVGLATSIRNTLNEAKVRIEAVVESAREAFTLEPVELE